MRCIKRCLILFTLCGLPLVANATPTVQEVKADNGITAWLIEDHSLPIVTMRLAFMGAGNASDPNSKEGLSDLAASLLDEGAGEMNALQFATAKESRAIRWSASGDDDTLVVGIQSLSEHMADASRLLGLALSAPRFDDEAIARMRASALQAVAQGEQDPGKISSKALAKLVLGDHPYVRSAFVTQASVKAITKADLKQYVQAHLTQSNLYVAVVGDITPAQVKALLEKDFSKLPKGTKAATLSTFVAPEKASISRIARDIPQTVVRFAGPGILRNDPDYLAAYVLNHVVGGDGLNARLVEEIREKRGLAYSAETQLDSMQAGALMSGGFATRSDQAEAAIGVLNDTLTTIRDKGITQQELDEAKQFLTGAFPLRLDSQGELASYLMSMQVHQLGRDYLETRNAQINAVTLDKVNALAKRLFDPAHITIVAVGAAAKPVADVKP